MTTTINPKPLRPINIASEYSDLKNLPIADNKEKRKEILMKAIETVSKMKIL